MNQRFRVIFFVIGIVSIVAMCFSFEVSFVQLWQHLCLAGYWLVPIIALWGVLYAMNTWAWCIIIRGSGSCPVSFWHLLRLTITGFALNYATPAGLLGGEPYKIMAMKEHIGTERATSSVVLFSMMHVFSHILYWLSAVILYAAFGLAGILPIGGVVSVMLMLIAVFCMLGVYLFMRGYKHGITFRIVKMLARLPGLKRWGGAFVERNEEKLRNIDAQIASLHAQNRRSFYGSLVLEYVGRALQSLEILLILLIFGKEATLENFAFAFLILAFTSLIANLLFFFPLQLGGREGGFALTTAQMGLTADMGIFVSVICRVREIFWVAVGVILLVKDKESH